MTIFIIGQTLTFAVILIGGFIRIISKLTEISTNIGHLETRRSEQRDDHDKLDNQVQGISRTVERHDTLLNERRG
jgi:cell division protein FtsL